jgi:hypothetical protein
MTASIYLTQASPTNFVVAEFLQRQFCRGKLSLRGLVAAAFCDQALTG